MPTDAEIAAYAETLPPIYRDILAAFPEVEPGRKAGFGLAFPTLAAHFANTRKAYRLDEIQEACNQLAKAGFVEIKNRIFAHPTDIGERLIAAVAGTPLASHNQVPQLPARKW